MQQRGILESRPEKEYMVDSVHRYNKKIEGLNYEYNQMLSSTVIYINYIRLAGQLKSILWETAIWAKYGDGINNEN